MALIGGKYTDIAIATGIVIGGLVAYKSVKSVSEAISDGTLDPRSTNNFVYRGTNNAWAWITGDPDFNLGSKLYELTHPNEGN